VTRRTILVAGGDSDPDLAALVATLDSNGQRCETLFAGARTHPRVTWDFESDRLYLGGEERRPEALFIRHDVFTSMADKRPAPAFRALAWYTTITGWAMAHPEVRMFNRESAYSVTNKLHVLQIAREVGLGIPRTVVTNDHPLLMSDREPRIAKPVNGGDYTRALEDIVEKAPHLEGAMPAPSIVQERLVPPELRVYAIGGRHFAFHLVADALDYRVTADCKVVPIEIDTVPAELIAGLDRLMQRMQLDYGAADFKACPKTGRFRFLEINNGPMFAAFDRACGGKLTNAIADHLGAP
jgi:glutathione synthase/RimK-type ligase-like ATP-grasp enzyme